MVNTWNPVFNKVMEIKQAYCKQTDVPIFYNCTIEGKSVSCLEYWIDQLNILKYKELFAPIQINQHGNLLLIRYGRYSDIYSGETDLTLDSFWDVHDGFYQECRSLVIDIIDEEMVLTPFKKFRNLNEGAENQLDNIIKKINLANDWGRRVEVTDKLDGSMQSARYYKGQFLMSGSQALSSEHSWRLADGYKMLDKAPHIQDLLQQYPDFTFIFEYISLADAHVVQYKKRQEGLYLIGMRCVSTGRQVPYQEVVDMAQAHSIKTTRLFRKNIYELLKDVKTYKSNEKEGYVLHIDGHYVKIKCDDYVNIHKILSKVASINLIIQHIADDQFDDLISKVPDAYMDRGYKTSKYIFSYVNKMEQAINRWYNKAPKKSRKQFMIYCNNKMPSQFVHYVRYKYLEKPYNVLKSGHENNPKYLKIHEMEWLNGKP